MEYRRLGKSSLVVSAMGLGCMGMSQSYGTPDDAESVATIHHAIDRGITMLDTADMYGGGKNEELVGAAIAKRRNEVILATKFGNMRMPDGRFLGVNGKAEYVQEACEACLKRLKISTIDLFYLHRVDTNVPIEETIGAMARLIEQGKVRYIGLSEAGAKTIRRAHATYPITALQSEFSLWTRDLEAEILDVCRELGIGIVPYSPLGRGIFDGHSEEERFRRPRFSANVSAFSGRKFSEKPGNCAASGGDGRGEKVHASATGAGLGAGKRERRGADTGNEAAKVHRREFGGPGNFTDGGGFRAGLTESRLPGIAAGARYPDEYMNRLGL